MVLPVGETFVFVKPFYLQASNARMPQLKKIVIAAGNRLIYEDTYDQALASLSGTAVTPRSLPGEPVNQAAVATLPGQAITLPSSTAPMSSRDTVILDHLQKLRREIDSLESELKKAQQK